MNHKSCLLSVLVILSVCFLSSCSHRSLPPYITVDAAGTPQNALNDLSPEAVYSILEWYLKDSYIAKNFKKNPELFLNEQKAALLTIRKQTVTRLEEQFPNLISSDSTGSFTFSPAYFSYAKTSQQDYLAVLEQLRKQLLQTGRIKIPVAQCVRKLNQQNEELGAAFTVWAEKNKNTLSLTSLNYNDKIAELNEIIDCLILQRRIKDALAEAAALRKSGDGIKALDMLQALKTNDIKNRSLSPIGDTTTLAQLETVMQSLPGQFIQDVLAQYEKQLLAELVRLPATAPSDENRHLFLNSIEESFSRSLRTWHQDSRFQPVLKNTAQFRQKLIQKLGDLRSRAYQSALNQNADRKYYWQTYQQYRVFRRELENRKDSSYALYSLTSMPGQPQRTILHCIEAEIYNEYVKILSTGAGYYLSIAEKHSNLTNKHGIALLLARMLQEMFSPVTTDTILTPQKLRYQDKIKALESKSLQFIQKDNLKQRLILQDFSSPAPGLGMSYTRDLDHSLRRLLKNENQQQITISNQAASAEEKDYMLFGGVIADYTSNEIIERQNIRTVMHYDAITRQDNPNFINDPEKALTTAQKERYIYQQQRYEQVIRMNEIERLAHVRIFFNLKGPGVNDVIELNEFYNKKFLIEQSHPINDRHQASPLKGYSNAGMQLSPTAPALLRNDRVWSAGELLDLARKDSLAMLSMKILYYIHFHPLYIAGEAGKAMQVQNYEKGVELWGICLAACGNSSQKDPAVFITPEFNPPAKCYQEELKKAENLQKQLQELRDTIQSKSFAALNQYLNSL